MCETKKMYVWKRRDTVCRLREQIVNKLQQRLGVEPRKSVIQFIKRFADATGRIVQGPWSRCFQARRN